MGMTIAEKVLARAAGLDAVRPGQYVDAKIDRVVIDEEFYRVHAAAVNGGLKGGIPRIWDTDRLHVFLEHHQPPLNDVQAVRAQLIREQAETYGLKHFQDIICGVVHQLAVENCAMPGELSLGSDSHSCAWGALNSVGTGMGEHELAFALTFGELWFKVPQSIKVILKGSFKKWADPKDVMFHLAKEYGAGFGLYKSLEFTGPAAGEMSISNRLTIAVHAVELGAKFGLFDYDDKTLEFLLLRPGFDAESVTPVCADGDAVYEREVVVDLDRLDPLVVKPHCFENVAELDEVAGTVIHQAQVGSCANGRVEDIRDVARVLQGQKIHKRVRFFIQPNSWTVYRQCMREGLLETILESGAQILSPGCHLCLGMQARLGNNENCITCTTRNHKGRMGGQNSNIYLANPKVIAASAIAGEIVDVRKAD